MSDGKSVSLLNFHGANKISPVKLPQQNKLGQEEHNKKLYKRRVKTGRPWMNHLPDEFHSELIETLFLELDPDAIKKTFKTFQNTKLRLNADDSSSIKSWAGMSNECYVKFNRFLFYLTGLRLLAPIKDIRALRKAKNQQGYTSISMRVMDMSRVIKKGGSVI